GRPSNSCEDTRSLRPSTRPLHAIHPLMPRSFLSAHLRLLQLPAQFFVRQMLPTAVLVLATALVGCAGTRSRTPQPPPVDLDAGKRQDVLMTALSLLNTPYRYGGSHPTQGFDCSGLLYYSVNAVTGIRVP